MSAPDVRIGVVGLGMGKHHCKAAKAARGCELVAVCDIDPERLNPVAEEYQVKAYSSYDAMLADPDIDVVTIASPSGLHVDMAMQALAAGKHMLIEKPVGIKVPKIRKLAAALKKSGIKAAVVFQSRTDPLNKRIKAAVENGRIGRLIGVHGMLPWYRTDSYYQGPHGSWKGTWNMDGGGSLMNQGIHTVDLIQWIAGRVKRVFGMFGIFAHTIEAEDKTVSTWEFENGALGTLNTTTAAYGGVVNRTLLFHGDRGTIYVADGLRAWKMIDDEDGEEEREMLSFYAPKALRPEAVTVATDPMSVGATGHVFHLEDLAEAIHENRPTYTTVENAMHAVEIANAIYESGRTGQPVTLGE